MPCDTIRRTGVTFEKVAYKPGHMALMMDALKHLGYQIQGDVPVISLRSHLPNGTVVKIWPEGAVASVTNSILYKNGKFQIPSPMREQFTLERIQQAYAREAIRAQAARNGWLVREVSATEFEVQRR